MERNKIGTTNGDGPYNTNKKINTSQIEETESSLRHSGPFNTQSK